MGNNGKAAVHYMLFASEVEDGYHELRINFSGFTLKNLRLRQSIPEHSIFSPQNVVFM